MPQPVLDQRLLLVSNIIYTGYTWSASTRGVWVHLAGDQGNAPHSSGSKPDVLLLY